MATASATHSEVFVPVDEGRSLLRFATAGSVDDGKSTLIGRLLHDTKSLFDDQVDQLAVTSERRGHDGLDLALLTDGLRAEREQGITIDVAYRYFSTPRRSFVIADTPGHAQYTRNMVTGASNADLAVVLVDARKGLTEQSHRHAVIAATLGIRRIVLAVNKMDLVDWREDRFDELVVHFADVAARFELDDVTAIPLSARDGDNVVERSANLPWYGGPTLLEHLETVSIVDDGAHRRGMRFPVQWVIRPAGGLDHRRYAGTVAAGSVRPGDEVVVLPRGQRTVVTAVEVADGPLAVAEVGAAVSLRLADEVDVGRGDVLVHADSDAPLVGRDMLAQLCWFGERPASAGQRVVVHHTTRATRAVLQRLVDRLDVVSGRTEADPAELAMNDLGSVQLLLADPVVADPYDRNRTTGSFIVVDEVTNATLAAGMIRSVAGR